MASALPSSEVLTNFEKDEAEFQTVAGASTAMSLEEMAEASDDGTVADDPEDPDAT